MLHRNVPPLPNGPWLLPPYVVLTPQPQLNMPHPRGLSRQSPMGSPRASPSPYARPSQQPSPRPAPRPVQQPSPRPPQRPSQQPSPRLAPRLSQQPSPRPAPGSPQQPRVQQHPGSPSTPRKGLKRQLDPIVVEDCPSPEAKRRPQGYSAGEQPPPANREAECSTSSGSGTVTAANEKWAKVSEGILRHFMERRQSKEMYSQKMALRNKVYRILQRIFPLCGLYVVGSSVNGLGSNSSDMDMCLMLTDSEVDQRNEAILVLRLVSNSLNQADFVTKSEIIYAKVPILKFSDRGSGVEIDLNINNSVGIRNTQLLNCYSRLDWRVAPLALAVKAWAEHHGINQAKFMTLSSYSLVLMLIHYLQCGCRPVVLPCLQKMLPKKFQEEDVRSLNLYEELPAFKSHNEQSLGELLHGFLCYYARQFSFSDSCISVRLGDCIPRAAAMAHRSPKNTRQQWKFICIEEPFDRTNTARSVYDYAAFQLIMNTFKTSLARLEATHDLSCVLPTSRSPPSSRSK
ncbi:poly(A) RNA polymerase gld-2 homolog A [Ixodes scapularis]